MRLIHGTVALSERQRTRVGGKALALAQMLQAGLTVPPALVVTADTCATQGCGAKSRTD